MNAYKLADWLEQVEHELKEKSQFKLSRASYMLRQQADRIAELEKDLHMLQRHYDQLDHDLPNAEPVAWMHKNSDYPISKHRSLEYNIPLYTTPQTKPLTIEDIKEIESKQRDMWNGAVHIEQFAWAIEAKVRGEK